MTTDRHLRLGWLGLCIAISACNVGTVDTATLRSETCDACKDAFDHCEQMDGEDDQCAAMLEQCDQAACPDPDQEPPTCDQVCSSVYDACTSVAGDEFQGVCDTVVAACRQACTQDGCPADDPNCTPDNCDSPDATECNPPEWCQDDQNCDPDNQDPTCAEDGQNCDETDPDPTCAEDGQNCDETDPDPTCTEDGQCPGDECTDLNHQCAEGDDQACAAFQERCA